MSYPMRWYLILSFLMTIPFGIFAQKEQVAFVDQIWVIDESLRKASGVLEPYKNGFRNATLHLNESGELELEIYNHSNPIPIVVPVTPVEIEDIVSALIDYLQSKEQAEIKRKIQPELKQNINYKAGKIYLYSGIGLYSILHGLGVSNEFAETYQIQNRTVLGYRTQFGKAFPYIYAASATAATYFIFRNKKISPAEANMYFFNSITGSYRGNLITRAGRETNWTLYILPGDYWTPYVGSMIEGWLSFLIARNYRFTYEQSMAWNTGNIWGTGIAAYASTAIFYRKNNIGRPFTNNALEYGHSFLSIGGAMAGILTMTLVHRDHPKTIGDYRVINTSGLIGMLMAESRINEWEAGLKNAGRAIGASVMGISSIAIGHILTNNTQFTPLEGSLISLTTVGTAIATYGIDSWWSNRPVNSSEDIPFRVIANGALVGWGLSYLGILATRSVGGKKRTTSIDLPVDFEFNPTAVGFLKSAPHTQASMLRMNMDVSMVKLRWSF